MASRMLRKLLLPAVLGFAGAAVAEPIVLPEGAVLRAGPGRNAAVLTVIPPGGQAEALDYGRYWRLVSFGGQRGYLHVANVIRKGAYLSPVEALSLESPGCDLGYPYSGSSRYFRNLTELRHTGILSALFGEHVYRPC